MTYELYYAEHDNWKKKQFLELTELNYDEPLWPLSLFSKFMSIPEVQRGLDEDLSNWERKTIADAVMAADYPAEFKTWKPNVPKELCDNPRLQDFIGPHSHLFWLLRIGSSLFVEGNMTLNMSQCVSHSGYLTWR